MLCIGGIICLQKVLADYRHLGKPSVLLWYFENCSYRVVLDKVAGRSIFRASNKTKLGKVETGYRFPLICPICLHYMLHASLVQILTFLILFILFSFLI